jgi:DNA-binding CsgD family transcriptional regulator
MRTNIYLSDRALELHEKGIPNDAIALRLGISRHHVWSAIKQATARRERLAAKTASPEGTECTH